VDIAPVRVAPPPESIVTENDDTFDRDHRSPSRKQQIQELLVGHRARLHRRHVQPMSRTPRARGTSARRRFSRRARARCSGTLPSCRAPIRDVSLLAFADHRTRCGPFRRVPSIRPASAACGWPSARRQRRLDQAHGRGRGAESACPTSPSCWSLPMLTVRSKRPKSLRATGCSRAARAPRNLVLSCPPGEATTCRPVPRGRGPRCRHLCWRVR
jgi:hypothetical protein